MQPEKTTFPEAGDFQDNIELLKIIRDNLPPDVKIFIESTLLLLCIFIIVTCIEIQSIMKIFVLIKTHF